jgi:predicted ATP-grasp superfamily ATP-dependent carboligase
MTGAGESSGPRPLVLIIGTGARSYREYLLSSISSEYRVHLFLDREPTWEREYAIGWTVVSALGDAGALIDAARELVADAIIDGVLCWDEGLVLPTAAVAAALGLPGGNPAAVGRCRDKHLTREALAAAGVAQPCSVLVGSAEEALGAAARVGYPVVLKPRALAASLGVVKVDSPAELAQSFPFANEATAPGAPSYERAVLVEEFADGSEISVDCAVHDGKVLPLFVARKEIGFPPYFEEVGHYVDGGDPLLAEPELQALLADTHAALGLRDGMTHCEVMLTADGPKVIEVNARLGGDMIPYIGLRATGIDPGLAAAAVACGRAPRVTRPRRQVGAVRFCYAAAAMNQLELDALSLPPQVDRLVGLLGEDHISLFPTGTVPGRVAYITAVARTVEVCRMALDQAATGLELLPHATVRGTAGLESPARRLAVPASDRR